MPSKLPATKKEVRPVADEFEVLFSELVKQVYDKGDRTRSKWVASRLERLLLESPELAESIRGEEVRSLIAELRGNLVEAIRCREAEIRKILELHVLSINTPNWKYVSNQYDFSDVSDRLDLLAMLYDEQGELNRAIAVLTESKEYCKAHRIEFDGHAVLEDLQQVKKELLTKQG